MANDEILQFLHSIGVDNRFISQWNNFLFINNLKFSRFSRKKEELFKAKFPQWDVIRSKVFQKMCIRASRVLSKSITPRETIFITNDKSCANLTLYVILESYTRKYGIKIISGEEDILEYKLDCVASPLTLDGEVENIIEQMFHGEKIDISSSKTKFEDIKIIYPLINIPESWIESWIQKNILSCINSPENRVSQDLLEFLEEFIPNIRENMLKSAMFVSK